MWMPGAPNFSRPLHCCTANSIPRFSASAASGALSMARWKLSAVERFEQHIMPEPNTGCWLWMSTDNGWGYGYFYYHGHQVGAHRFSYQQYVGPIPDGLYVLHRCDVRCCVNPDHLWLGTHQDNMDDMTRKGRANRIQPFGDGAANRSLCAAQVIEIVRDWGHLPATKVGPRFGVSSTTIKDIRTGKTWSKTTGVRS